MEVLLGIVAVLAVGALIVQGVASRPRARAVSVPAEQELRVVGSDLLDVERDELAVERERMAGEREQLAAERDRLSGDRGKLAAEREQLAGERERLRALGIQLAGERDELVAQRSRYTQREERLVVREERLSELASGLQRDRERLAEDRAGHEVAKAELNRLVTESEKQLERLAGISAAQAQAEVLAKAEISVKKRAQQLAREITEEAVGGAEAGARRIITTAIERIAVRQSSEAVISTVELPSEDMKGRIIGREGRNIRAFEQVTGVTLVVDDTPGVVLLSCFDPVRREVGRLTLTGLVSDGRIDPARIEEAHEAASRDVEVSCVAAAQRAIDDLGLQGIDRGLLPTIGALGYRTSYGQNVLEHSVECARLAGAMAAEIGLDTDVCRRAAFLHDLGKAVITHGEGSHALEGAELARRLGQPDEVVHAIAAHHNEVAPQTAVAVLTQAADAISSSRLGARRESYDAYVKRLERLEELATRHEGVEKAFALQAGREIRVMVVPEIVDDTASRQMARQIADSIEAELAYPGRIKVTVIRETRTVEVAQ